MLLPSFLAQPFFHLIYAFMRRREGATLPPIRRKVTMVDETRKQVFDMLLDGALIGNPRVPISYNLVYPKSEFLNYICDWRGHHFGHWIYNSEENYKTIIEKISITGKGRKRSPESVRKQFETRKERGGCSNSEETKKKISKTLKGHKFGMNGKTHTLQTKENISKGISEWHKKRKMKH